MKKYITPEMDYVIIASLDVITSSFEDDGLVRGVGAEAQWIDDRL